jgi:hypothetical protein
MARLESMGVDLGCVNVHGQKMDSADPMYFVGFQLRYLRSMLDCFQRDKGAEWLEIPRPTRKAPLVALRIRPASRDEIMKWKTSPSSFFA